MYRKVPKRILDFWASLIFLIVCSPLLIIVTICLHFANNGSGTLFIQDRLGLNGKVFRIIKFKTMTDERDENGKMLPDEVRLTKEPTEKVALFEVGLHRLTLHVGCYN